MSNINIDEWFKRIRERYATHMLCGKGCSACCHGLFDISLADAVDVAKGFRELLPEQQKQIHSRAADIHSAVAGVVGNLSRPTLFREDDSTIDQIVEAANTPACPCLGDSGECLIYEHRPFSCRVEGVPMVDRKDGLFGDWCELNFTEGVPETAMRDLELDYDEVNVVEESQSAAIAAQAGLPDSRAVTFIPFVILEYDAFWKPLLQSVTPKG